LIFRSVNNIVIAPAKTGRDNTNKKVVTITDQTNNGVCSIVIPLLRIINTVTMKLILPRIEDAPAKCSLKIAKSTATPPCPNLLESGGYTVHPVPTPLSETLDNNKRINEGGSSQNLKLLRRGNLRSGEFSINGSNQLPNPPINIGMTMKKIIKKACAVTNTL
jgi:hypothetical protein